MSIIFNPTAGTTYAIHDALAALLRDVGGNCHHVGWMKGYSTGDYFMSLGASTANDSAFHLLSSSPNLFLRARSGGVDANHTKDMTGLMASWVFYALNFRTDTTAGISIQYSINGDTLSVMAGGEGGTALPNQLTIGAGRFNGTSAFSHVENVGFAYPAFGPGLVTQQQIADMYGSGPGAGDAKAPWLVLDNPISAQSWKNGTVAVAEKTIGTAWTLVGANVTAADSDNPTLIETIGGSSRRRRRSMVARR